MIAPTVPTLDGVHEDGLDRPDGPVAYLTSTITLFLGTIASEGIRR
jgi:hypothetical protein